MEEGGGRRDKKVKKVRERGEDGGCTWASVGLAAPESISSKRTGILGIEILPGGKSALVSQEHIPESGLQSQSTHQTHLCSQGHSAGVEKEGVQVQEVPPLSPTSHPN